MFRKTAMFRNSIAAAALMLASAAAVPALAQADYGVHAGQLEIPVNKSQVVTSDRPIDRAMIGNADIADVLPISDRSVYVLGQEVGTTSLTLYDRSNRVIAVMDVQVGPDVDAVRQQVRQLIPDSQIDVALSNGSIVLSGLVSDAGAADRAARLAAAYAGENVVNLLSLGGSQQVMLEVRFAEINRNVGENLGVSGFINNSDGDFGAVIGEGASASGTGFLGLGNISDSFGIFRTIFQLGDLNVEAYLNSLERKGLSKILAEPTLVALSGERASFLAGGEFPIPVLQGGGGGGNDSNNGVTIEFKPFGVSLGFTPTVLGNKVINLIVEPEVSSIDPSASITVNGLVVPGLQTRRASTTVELRDGESFAIAGLLRQDRQTTIRQLPLLGSIPIIGTLFRSTSFQNGETELLIIVTPRLVQPIRPEQVVLPTDRVEDQDVLDTLLAGDDYQPVPLRPAAPTQPVTTRDPGYEY